MTNSPNAVARTRQDLSRTPGRGHPARSRSGRVRARHPASAEGRVHRGCRTGHRPPLDAPAARRRRRHHAVQLPGHGADVEWPAAIACGNTFILKPSERDPVRADACWPNSSSRPACRKACSTSSRRQGSRRRHPRHPDIKAVGFVGSTPIAEYVYSRGCANGKRVQCFGGAKNHMIIMPDADMDQAADALIGPATVRRRALHGDLGRGSGRRKDRRRLIEKLKPRVEALKVGPSTAGQDADYGPLVTPRPRSACASSTSASRKARAGRRRPRLLAAGL
jgi:acyl-CoA reductase-like NAD-dependent aldehyde dehydrogenase